MPQRPIPLVAGEYYHLYSRGNNRQNIFRARKLFVLSSSCAQVSYWRGPDFPDFRSLGDFGSLKGDAMFKLLIFAVVSVGIVFVLWVSTQRKKPTPC